MLKIAVINDTVYPFSKGGAQKRVYEISRRLVQRGHEVHWYGMDYGAKEIEGIRLHAVCPAYRMYTNEGRRLVSQALRFALRLRVKDNVDVIDCMNFPYLHCFGVKLDAVISNTPLVITWFEFWGKYWHEYSGKLAPVGMMIEKMVTKLPNMIIADSEKVKSQLVNANVKRNKIRVVPDGVNTRMISQIEPFADKFDVVYAGRILTHKHVDTLIRAVSGMKDITVAIVGDGENRMDCEKLSMELGVSNRIKFFGWVEKDEDVFAIMKSSKVLVMPSTQEGHPLVIPEANACGIPVVGIRDVCDEFINEGSNGYLTVCHPVPLGGYIARALEMYPTLKDTCLKESKKYDWELITDKVEAVYKEVV